MVAVKVQVFGRVQGVFFRAFTRDLARRVGVKGYVRNMEDGSVEALLVGEREAVDKVIEGMREGPPAARVERLETMEVEVPSPPPADFRIEY